MKRNSMTLLLLLGLLMGALAFGRFATPVAAADGAAAVMDDDDDDDGDDNEVNGVIDSFPAGMIGTWVISGVSYTADNTTRFEQDDGAFAVGACVEVEFDAATMIARKIETDDDCNGGNGHVETRGTLDSFPAGMIGTWVVNGVSYTADSTTRFEQEDGAFVVGGCVEVRYDPATMIASKIESEDDCNGNSGGYAERYGLVESFPADLLGTWVIGGVSYTTDATTIFSQHDGPFVVGGCVEVRYDPTTLVASRIETDNDCRNDDDDHGNSYRRVYGTVSTFPADLIGTWIVNDVSYTADATTRFDQSDGAFVVGGCVEVNYLPNTFVAIEIETAEAYHCGNNGGHDDDDFERYGAIDSFPAGLIGTWVINGVVYEAGNGTRFEQEDGAFAVGQCAEVKYLAGTPNIALEIETEDGYHCGNGNNSGSYQSLYGVLDSFPTDLLGDWVVAGVTYSADATTIFNQEEGAFAIGGCVEVTFQTANNLALQIETEDPYHCGNSSTPPAPAAPSMRVNHNAGADGSAFVFAGQDLPADSPVTVKVNGQAVGSARTNSTGKVTFAVQPSSDAAGRSANYNVSVEVNGASVNAPSVAHDNSQAVRTLPANYSAPVIITSVVPLSISLSNIAISSRPTLILTAMTLLLAGTGGVILRRAERW